MAKKSVVVISPFFSPNKGGVETCLDNLVIELNKHNIPSIFLTFQPLSSSIDAKKIEQIDFAKIIRLKSNYIKIRWRENNAVFWSLFIIPRLYFYLLFRVKKLSSYDVYHVHGFQSAIVLYLFSKISKKSYVVSLHAHLDEYKFKFLNKISFFLIKKSLSSSKKILVNTFKMKNEITKLGIEENKIVTHVQWNTDNYIINKKFSNFNNRLKILFVGRLIEGKGVRIFVNLAKNCPLLDFTMIGVGPLLEEIKENKPKNFKLIPGLDQNELPEIYFNHDICIVPSMYQDAYPRVVTEAIGCGTPVIATNLGGISEAMSEEVGWLVAFENPNNLENEITNLLLKINEKRDLIHEKNTNCYNFARKNYSNLNFTKTLNSYLES